VNVQPHGVATILIATDWGGSMKISKATLDELEGLKRRFEWWRLAPDRWQRIEPTLRDLGEALARGDEPRALRLMDDIERDGPTRLMRLSGDSEPSPILSRETLMDHWNHLVGRPGAGGVAEDLGSSESP
jgi:hypothetical protein